MEGATRGNNPLMRAGLAYVEFAHQNRGLFRLMFGPVLAERAKYPALQAATNGVEAFLMRGVADLDQRPLNENLAAMGAWGLVHGLSYLVVDAFIPAGRAASSGGAYPGGDQIAAAVALGADQLTALIARGRLTLQAFSESAQDSPSRAKPPLNGSKEKGLDFLAFSRPF